MLTRSNQDAEYLENENVVDGHFLCCVLKAFEF